MSNVFDITTGLEIIAPLKPEGHCSVYKARRAGNIFSAVKLLPQAVNPGTSGVDQSTYILDELAKLEKSGEQANPNIACIRKTGISNKGNRPFIEMEFIDGPDLDTLLQPPHPPVFTIPEILRVAEHLSNALAYCHSLEIKHGNITCGNIRFASHAGNYVLVNFGFMATQAQRRQVSLILPHSEYKAPEQQYGQLLYQSDVYGFGMVMFKLLTGTFPDALKNDPIAGGSNGASSDAASLLQVVQSLRDKQLPTSRNETEQEIIPEWLTGIIETCLDRNPVNRFGSGTALHDAIISKISQKHDTAKRYYDVAITLQAVNKQLTAENETLKKNLEKQQFFEKVMYEQWKETNQAVVHKDNELLQLKQQVRRPALSRPIVYTLVLAACFTGALAAYLFMPGKASPNVPPGDVVLPVVIDSSLNPGNRPVADPGRAVDPARKNRTDDATYRQTSSLQANEQETQDKIRQVKPLPADTTTYTPKPFTGAPNTTGDYWGDYKVKAKAYFHDKPDAGTRRSAFITHWNNATLHALADQDGFVYVIFTNHLGQISRGWINKEDLIRQD